MGIKPWRGRKTIIFRIRSDDRRQKTELFFFKTNVINCCVFLLYKCANITANYQRQQRWMQQRQETVRKKKKKSDNDLPQIQDNK